MNYDDHLYHLQREEQCRRWAGLAQSDDIRRRHEELAGLHAVRASLYAGAAPIVVN